MYVMLIDTLLLLFQGDKPVIKQVDTPPPPSPASSSQEKTKSSTSVTKTQNSTTSKTAPEKC